MTDELYAALMRFAEAVAAAVDRFMECIRDVAHRLMAIDWSALAEIKARDPDLFAWRARGPIRRVQLRRARMLMRRDD